MAGVQVVPQLYNCCACFRKFKQKSVVKTGACAKGQLSISVSKLLFSKETIGVRFPRLLGI